MTTRRGRGLSSTTALKLLDLLCCDALNVSEVFSDDLARFFDIVIRLQPEPETFLGAEGFGQTQRGICSNRALAEHYFVDATRRDADCARQGILAEIHRHEKFLKQNLSGMNVL